ncbi:sensor histidine kinase [Paenibacillus sp. 22594]|uniref:sensor histidine kinase n=1 Tax=Paenibacillus sp. 22594 TaxID=3453947 RepID=UPI003F853CD0
MGLLNKVSIRMRVTLLTGGILLAASMLLTWSSIYNAQDKFMDLNKAAEEPRVPTGGTSIGSAQSEADDVLEEGVASVPAIAAVQAKQSFDSWSYIYLVVISGAGMIVTYIVAGKALKPLQDLNYSIVNITEHNLKERVPASASNDEIGSLANSFNAMLERLNESFLRQKRFSANVSHELKTPLSIMNAGIQVLRLDETPTAEDYKETVEMAERNIKRLMSIVDDLLVLTNDSNVEYMDEINLNQLFLQVEAELLPLYNDKNIHVTHEFELDTILGHAPIVYRAFYNLLENAAKYNIMNGTIEIRTWTEDRMGKISISDSGMGIPSEELDRIFEPFYRVDSSRSRKIGGAGLGLSIVKAIIEKHGWSIEGESTVNVGTCFVISVIC